MGPSTVTRNLLANIAGKLTTGVLTLILVPVYVRFVGVEAYGILGLYATLLAAASLLEVGLGTTLNRELARLSARPDTADESRDLTRTFEVVYWVAAAVIAGLGWLLAPSGAAWLRPDRLSQEQVRDALRIMAVTLAVQFPSALYTGGLLGLQRHVLLNVIIAAGGFFRGIGVVGILAWVSPTLGAYLWWQFAVSAVHTLFMAAALWNALPGGGRPARVRRSLLGDRGRLAAGLWLISVTSLVLTQTDRVLLSRMLPLDDFGYYLLAATAATGLYTLAYPVHQAVFPRLSQVVSQGDLSAISEFYHKAAQTMAVVVIPPGVTLVLFSSEVMGAWTRDPETTRRTAHLVALLAAGTTLHGLVHVPYALQLAHGWTRLSLAVNAGAIIALLPMLFFATRAWGAWGAAAAWAALNVIYATVQVYLMHRRLLPGERARWYLTDTALPLAAALGTAASIRWAQPPGATMSPAGLALVGAAGAASLLAAILAAPFPRSFLLRLLRKRAP